MHSISFRVRLYFLFFRDCLRDHIRNSEDPEIPCPCSEDGADCRQVITAQEIQAVRPDLIGCNN